MPLIQDIQRIDRRLLDYEAEEFEIIAGDQKRLVVDALCPLQDRQRQDLRPDRAGRRAGLAGLLDLADQLGNSRRAELGAPCMPC